jgi:ubiquinone/menaquinone biosynthesis C-methylase UbiE
MKRSDRPDGAPGSFVPALAFHALTPLYDLLLEVLGLGRSFHAGVARLVGVRSGESVLDLGCGTGTLLRSLLAETPTGHYVGLDADPRVLAIAGRKLGEARGAVQLVTGYSQDLPFPDGAFDVVVSTLIFHHLSDATKRSTLAEVGRVLKPSGRFFLVDFGRPQSRSAKVMLTVGSLFDGRANTRANLAGEIPGLLAAAGFRAEEVRPPHRAVRYIRAIRAQHRG